jgi:hypothetical protein
MENQYRKIKGYRELTQDEIDLMNEIKIKGEELETLIDKVNNHYTDASLDATDDVLNALEKNHKFIEIAIEHLQLGIMALNRAVAKPVSF